MKNFLQRRIFYAIIAVIGGPLMIFVLSRMSGDPRVLFIDEHGGGFGTEAWEKMGEEMGLDKPVPIQYAMWLKDILTGDFGKSLAQQQPVTTILKDRAGASIRLGVAAWIFGTLVGVPLGILSAINRGSAWDYIARTFALFGQSLPSFWSGIMGILIFAGVLGWLPAGTMGEGSFSIKHLILPAIVLGWLPAAGYLRLTRSSMLEVMDTEYIKLARAKGVKYTKVVWKHAFRNALIVPLTYSGLLLIGFITGTTVVETVFSWPGLGRLAINSVTGNDFPVVAAIMFFTMLLYVVVVLFLDLIYAFIDPRIRAK